MKRKTLVIGWQCWGKGDDEAEAMKKCRKANGGKVSTYLVYDVPEDATVDDVGNICYAQCEEDQRPKVVKRVRNFKAV